MCGSFFSGGGKAARMLPPPDNSGIEAREQTMRDDNLQDQDEASKARKKQLQAGLGRRSLLTSSGGGYLSNTKNNLNLS